MWDKWTAIVGLSGSLLLGAATQASAADDRIEIEIALHRATGAPPAAKGKLRFRDRGSRQDARAEIEQVPLGNYEFFVGGVLRATAEVVNTARGTEGEVQFRNPVEPGKVLLDFDPRGELVEWKFNGDVVLTSQFPGDPGDDVPGDDDPGDDNGDDNGGGDGGGDGVEIEISLIRATGAPPAARGKLRFRDRGSRQDARAEIEQVPLGNYDFFVGGVLRASAAVVNTARGTEGKVQFRNPVEPGKIHLDFDPRGELIEWKFNGTVILSSQFPAGTTGAPGSPNDSGSDDSNSNDSSSSSSSADDSAFVNQKVKTNFVRTDASSRARGSMQLTSKKSKAELRIRFTGLDGGKTYTLTVEGVPVATVVTNRKGKAKLRFSTRSGRNKLPLDFDPGDADFELLDGDTLVLSGNSGGSHIGGGMASPNRLKVELNNVGPDSNAHGDAEIRNRPGRTDFQVEIEDLAIGTYDLLADGVVVAMIGVSSQNSGTQGEVEFSTDLTEADKLPLEFDPAGALFEIVRDGTVYLSIQFPA